MERLAASLPESLPELCLIRLGLQIRKLSALPFVLRLGRSINRANAEAIKEGAGLLHSASFFQNARNLGYLQYWRSFETLEAWSHRSPHSDWWREALERMRTKADFGIFHETYLVPRDRIESIYLNCLPAGLATFGETRPPVGTSTAARDRLKMRPQP